MPALSVCEVPNIEVTLQTVVSTLVTDVVLLLIMLAGLLRLRIYGTMFGLAKLLWKQVGKAVLGLFDCLYVSLERV